MNARIVLCEDDVPRSASEIVKALRAGEDWAVKSLIKKLVMVARKKRMDPFKLLRSFKVRTIYTTCPIKS
ncbi:MAG: hypothetical protein AAB897_00895 [Patescibacteria group bacterium]